MKEIILCKYGELVLKGANKPHFEAMLLRRIRARAERYGDFAVRSMQSTVYIEPQSEDCDFQGMLDSMTKMFGFAGVTAAGRLRQNDGRTARLCARISPPPHDRRTHVQGRGQACRQKLSAWIARNLRRSRRLCAGMHAEPAGGCEKPGQDSAGRDPRGGRIPAF